MASRQRESHVLYTIGYEGRTPANLVMVLKEHGVRRLVDVRLQPSSRRKGFSLMSLFEHLRKAGITYEHKRELGNPPEIRALFHKGQLERGKKKYRAFLENGSSNSIDILVGLARIEPTAILCLEREASHCHRAVVADVAVARSSNRIQVVHL